ncbi:MAG: GvpL/GvpF family gas vesicle protein [Victivallaceae bacterium]|nr:GvpL/GvpF family gas vesicle protein [Victivallaceae bacterium]
MTKVQGKYVFGVIPAGVQPLTGRPGQFEVVKSGKFTAIVAASEVSEYENASAEFRMRRQSYHQQVLEEIMAEGYTVIPMKPGTIVGSNREVTAILERGNRVFQEVLEKTADKLEVSLLAVWNDFRAVLKQIGETDELLAFRRELLHRSGLITERDQHRAVKLMKQVLERKKKRCVQQINDRLMRAGQEIRVHEPLNDRIVFNTSFLLDKNRRKYFEEQVEVTEREFGRELKFRLLGPLPGYSFYTLEAVPVDFEGFPRSGTDHIFDVRPGQWPPTAPDLSGFDTPDQTFKTVMDYCAAADFIPAKPEYYSPFRKAVSNHSFVVRL